MLEQNECLLTALMETCGKMSYLSVPIEVETD